MGKACVRAEKEDENTVLSIKLGPDYQEFPEKLAGSGIKATVSWQATITRAQLSAKREEFWRSRTEGNRRVWVIIKAAVEADAATALTILQNNHIKLVKGSISLLEDQEGTIYRIPVFMVNNPMSFHKEKKAKTLEVKTSEEQIKVKIRKPGVAEDIIIEILNTSKVADLRRLYSEKSGFLTGNIKFFFHGKDLKDHDTLAKNFIENDMVVQAFVKVDISN